jgi:hypothetical protein
MVTLIPKQAAEKQINGMGALRSEYWLYLMFCEWRDFLHFEKLSAVEELEKVGLLGLAGGCGACARLVREGESSPLNGLMLPVYQAVMQDLCRL